MNNVEQPGLLSIGDFVKICGTTRATLYHYEKIGLLTPSINAMNGYRYYKLSDYYLYMYIAHLTRIGYTLEEIREYVSHKNLDTYIRAQKDSYARLSDQQEQLRLRNERTQRGLRALNRSLGRPMNLPQITYRKEEYYLRMPFDGDLNSRDCIACQAKLRDYASRWGIDIQRHFLGFYSDLSVTHPLPFFGYVLMKLNEKCESKYLFTRPSGMYISMYYRGPFVSAGDTGYGIVADYMKTHRFKALTGIFVEDIVGPFISFDPSEYIAELSVRIE